jgi:nitrogen regulatory protein PII
MYKMKLVSATIPAAVLDDLRDVLVTIGIKGMTVSAADVRSREAKRAPLGCLRQRPFGDAMELVIETVIGDPLVVEVVKAIVAVSSSATAGGVSIRISDVIYGVRIRNAELVHEG